MDTEKTIRQFVNEAVSSSEMEGLHVDEICKEMCYLLLKNEITLDQYIEYANRKFAVSVK